MARPAAVAVLSAEELARAGRALFGDQWQTSIAAELGVSDRHMRRFAAGDSPVTADVALLLERLCKARAGELYKHVHRIRKAIDKARST